MFEKTELEVNENLSEGNSGKDLTSEQMEYLQQTEGMNQQTWEQLSSNQRLMALNTLEAKLAESIGIEPLQIVETGNMLPDTCLAIVEEGKILVNSLDLANPKIGEQIVGSVLGASLGKNNPISFKFQEESDYEVVNARAIGGRGNTISFTGTYKYCTPSSCSGWARDGEYVSC